MLALGFESVKELERQCGFISELTGRTTNIISDLFEGKKGSVNIDALVTLANVLKTNTTWLASGTGSETAVSPDSNHAVDMQSGAMRQIRYGDVASVDKSHRARIFILRIDPNTGECAFHFHNDLAPTIRAGLIVDPAVYVTKNVYLECAEKRTELATTIKTAKVEGKQDIVFIIDSNK
jgi:hypothetical protein